MSVVRGLDPIAIYEYLLEARAKLFDWVRPISLEQYTKEFPFGLKTLRKTMVEIAMGEYAYTRRLRGEQVPPPEDRPLQRFYETDFASLERAWQEQVEETRRALSEITDWSRPVEYVARPANQSAVRISTTAGGIATQLALHEVHHRAQAMAMLRQLGIAAQNLDYSLMMFKREQLAE